MEETQSVSVDELARDCWAVVERIAAAHGWSVTVRDSADGGACFEVHPAENPDASSDSADSDDSGSKAAPAA